MFEILRNKKSHELAKFAEKEFVKVRSRDHIKRTLDSSNKLDGCLFSEQMSDYCEQKHKVLKVVYNYFDEYKSRMYRVKKPFYLLENLICNGQVDSFEHRCDHSCYLLWHEEWLEST